MESMFEDGISCFKKAVELSDGLPWFLGSLGWAYGASGQAEEAGEVLSELDTLLTASAPELASPGTANVHRAVAPASGIHGAADPSSSNPAW